jgi:hypothetical protein
MFLANYPSTVYCDTTHFNTTGYSIFASRVSAFLLGEGVEHINKVSDGSVLLTRPSIDNVILYNGTTFNHQSGTDTPNEDYTTKGIEASIPANGELAYSFYADRENLIVLPSFYLAAGGTLTVELDFGVVQPDYALDSSVYQNPTFTPNIPSSVSYVASSSITKNKINLINTTDPILLIANKGWHVLKIKVDTSSSVFDGLEFISFEDVNQNKRLNALEGSAVGSTYISTSNATSLTEWRVNIDTLVSALKLDTTVSTSYYKWLPLKLVIYNTDNSILEYPFTLGRKTDGLGLKFVATPTRYNLIGSPINEKTLSNITFDIANQQLVFTFSGTAMTYCNISIDRI